MRELLVDNLYCSDKFIGLATKKNRARNGSVVRRGDAGRPSQVPRNALGSTRGGLALPAAVLLGVDDLLDLPAESHEQGTTMKYRTQQIFEYIFH